jgi:hypothetical protein
MALRHRTSRAPGGVEKPQLVTTIRASPAPTGTPRDPLATLPTCGAVSINAPTAFAVNALGVLDPTGIGARVAGISARVVSERALGSRRNRCSGQPGIRRVGRMPPIHSASRMIWTSALGDEEPTNSETSMPVGSKARQTSTPTSFAMMPATASSPAFVRGRAKVIFVVRCASTTASRSSVPWTAVTFRTPADHRMRASNGRRENDDLSACYECLAIPNPRRAHVEVGVAHGVDSSPVHRDDAAVGIEDGDRDAATQSFVAGLFKDAERPQTTSDLGTGLSIGIGQSVTQRAVGEANLKAFDGLRDDSMPFQEVEPGYRAQKRIVVVPCDLAEQLGVLGSMLEGGIELLDGRPFDDLGGGGTHDMIGSK